MQLPTRRRTLIALGLILVAFLLFYSELFFEGKDYLPSGKSHYYDRSVNSSQLPERFNNNDTLEYYYPAFAHIHERIRDFDIPYWSYERGFGVPIWGNLLSNFFEPLRMISYLIADPVLAWNSYHVILNFLGAFFMFLLALRIGGSFWGAGVGTLLFIGLNFYSQDHYIGVTRNYLIMALYFLHAINLHRTVGNFIGVIFSLVSILLSGDPQMAFHAMSFICIVILFEYIQGKSVRKLFENSTLIFISLLIGGSYILSIYLASSNSYRDVVDPKIVSDIYLAGDFILWVITYMGILSPLFIALCIKSKDYFVRSILFVSIIVCFYSSTLIVSNTFKTIFPFLKIFQTANYFLVVPLSIVFPLLFSLGIKELLKTRIGKYQYLVLFVVLLSLIVPIRNFHNASKYFFTNSNNVFPESSCFAYLEGELTLQLSKDNLDLPPNILFHFGGGDVRLYDLLADSDYFNLLVAAGSISHVPDVGGAFVEIVTPSNIIKKASQLGITRVLSREKLDEKKLLFEGDDYCYSDKKKYWIYKIPNSTRVEGLSALSKVKTNDLALHAFSKSDASDIAFTTSPKVGESLKFPSDIVKEFKFDGDRIIVNTTGGAGAILVRQSYNKDWRAFAGGEELKVMRANGNFMVVRIKEGTRQLVLEYRPRSVVLSKILFLLGCILMGIKVFYLRKRLHG